MSSLLRISDVRSGNEFNKRIHPSNAVIGLSVNLIDTSTLEAIFVVNNVKSKHIKVTSPGLIIKSARSGYAMMQYTAANCIPAMKDSLMK